jgi:hypothetical protein
VAEKEPVAELQQQLSSDGATATPWAKGRRGLEQAHGYLPSDSDEGFRYGRGERFSATRWRF